LFPLKSLKEEKEGEKNNNKTKPKTIEHLGVTKAFGAYS